MWYSLSIQALQCPPEANAKGVSKAYSADLTPPDQRQPKIATQTIQLGCVPSSLTVAENPA